MNLLFATTIDIQASRNNMIRPIASIKKGILGKSPDIPTDIGNDPNVPFQYDFRSVYASVLERWFCVEQPAIDHSDK